MLVTSETLETEYVHIVPRPHYDNEDTRSKSAFYQAHRSVRNYCWRVDSLLNYEMSAVCIVFKIIIDNHVHLNRLLVLNPDFIFSRISDFILWKQSLC